MNSEYGDGDENGGERREFEIRPRLDEEMEYFNVLALEESQRWIEVT